MEVSGVGGRFPESHQVCPSVVIGDGYEYPLLNVDMVACDGLSSGVVLERTLGFDVFTLLSSVSYVAQYAETLSGTPVKGASSIKGSDLFASNSLAVTSRGAAVYYISDADDVIYKYTRQSPHRSDVTRRVLCCCCQSI